MSRQMIEDCEKCGQTVTHTTRIAVPATRDQPACWEYWCDKCAGIGAYDPENRDWDAERDLREADGDY